MKSIGRVCVILAAAAAIALSVGCPNPTAGSSDCAITAFAFTAAANTGLAADATATVSGTYVTASIPVG